MAADNGIHRAAMGARAPAALIFEYQGEASGTARKAPCGSSLGGPSGGRLGTTTGDGRVEQKAGWSGVQHAPRTAGTVALFRCSVAVPPISGEAFVSIAEKLVVAVVVWGVVSIFIAGMLAHFVEL
jgi:hypothetical protein